MCVCVCVCVCPINMPIPEHAVGAQGLADSPAASAALARSGSGPCCGQVGAWKEGGKNKKNKKTKAKRKAKTKTKIVFLFSKVLTVLGQERREEEDQACRRQLDLRLRFLRKTY